MPSLCEKKVYFGTPYIVDTGTYKNVHTHTHTQSNYHHYYCNNSSPTFRGQRKPTDMIAHELVNQDKIAPHPFFFNP